MSRRSEAIEDAAGDRYERAKTLIDGLAGTGHGPAERIAIAHVLATLVVADELALIRLELREAREAAGGP